MEDSYSSYALSIFDEIIGKLASKGYLNYEESNKYSSGYFEILQSEQWFFLHKTDQTGIIYVGKSDNFDKLLLGGTFSERYNREKQSRQQRQCAEININNSSIFNSPIAAGNDIQQTVSNPILKDLPFDEAINDIKQSKNFSSEKKQDIIDSLEELKDCAQKSERPGKSLLKNIFRWSEDVVQLSNNLTHIYTSLKPLFDALFSC